MHPNIYRSQKWISQWILTRRALCDTRFTLRSVDFLIPCFTANRRISLFYYFLCHLPKPHPNSVAIDHHTNPFMHFKSTYMCTHHVLEKICKYCNLWKYGHFIQTRSAVLVKFLWIFRKLLSTSLRIPPFFLLLLAASLGLQLSGKCLQTSWAARAFFRPSSFLWDPRSINYIRPEPRQWYF